MTTRRVHAGQNAFNVGDTHHTVSLRTLIKMIRNYSGFLQGKLMLLNLNIPVPTRIEELYILKLLNTQVRPCSTDPRYSYNTKHKKWEWF